ncbi:MAG: hypothetical protein HFG28_15165 [Eubacterium sp.]|jgi:hypothetical protein|nr:hypothetical protein [Eubacterium sp.]
MITDKLYVFSIQDNICGGIIRAASEDVAREKLSKQRGITMDSGTTIIYELSGEEFDEFDVCDLW